MGKIRHRKGDIFYGYAVIPPRDKYTGHFIYERALQSAVDLAEGDGEGEEILAVFVKVARVVRRGKPATEARHG